MISRYTLDKIAVGYVLLLMCVAEAPNAVLVGLTLGGLALLAWMIWEDRHDPR